MSKQWNNLPQGSKIVVGIGCGAVILICCSTLAVAAAVSNNGTPGAAAATATPTTDPRRAVIAYTTIVTKDSGTVGTDAGALGPACSNGDSSACNTALQTFDTDVKAFQQDLKHTPAPACFKSVDTDLQTGLVLYDAGAQTAMSGIAQQDAALIRQGSATISQGTTYITKVSAEIPKASC